MVRATGAKTELKKQHKNENMWCLLCTNHPDSSFVSFCVCVFSTLSRVGDVLTLVHLEMSWVIWFTADVFVAMPHSHAVFFAPFGLHNVMYVLSPPYHGGQGHAVVALYGILWASMIVPKTRQEKWRAILTSHNRVRVEATVRYEHVPRMSGHGRYQDPICS